MTDYLTTLAAIAHDNPWPIVVAAIIALVGLMLAAGEWFARADDELQAHIDAALDVANEERAS